MAKQECVTLFPEIEQVTRRFSNEQFGELIRAVIAYRFRGELYEGDDPAIDTAFLFLSNQVDRAENMKKKMSKLVQKRWEDTRSTEEAGTAAPVCESDTAVSERDTPILSAPVRSDPILSNPVRSGREDAPAPGRTEKKAYGAYGWVTLTDKQYQNLSKKLGQTELQRCIDYLDESCQSTGNRNNWVDFYVVIQRCARQQWGMDRHQRGEIPKGASGELGEAELEAIQRVLKGENYGPGASRDPVDGDDWLSKLDAEERIFREGV